MGADHLDLMHSLRKEERQSTFFLWLPILFLWRSVHRLTFITVCSITIVWSSAFIYITFYYLYIPTMVHQKIVNLQFDATCSSKCLEPYAMVPLSDHKTPTLFNRGQQYVFTVELHLPESEVNWDQGMFMVSIELYDYEQRLISRLSRSAILQYKSPILRILNIVAYWPMLITGFRQEEQFLSLTVIDNYIDGTAPGVGNAVLAKVILKARQIQVYSSNLIIHAKLRGLRYFMVQWPLTSATLGIFSIMSFLTMITVLSVYRAVSVPPEESGAETLSGKDDGLATGSLEGDLDDVYEFPDSTVAD